MSTTPIVNGELVKSPGEAQGLMKERVPMPQPQYIQGFEGAASAPFAPEALAVLSAPVAPEEVETKPNGIVYLPGVWYRRILTRAFGAGAWALLPRGPARTMGEIVIYPGALYILGRFVSEAVGECETRGGMSYASSLEGARTDSLTRCCKDLGMAAELWDPEWRAGWQAKYCSREWKKHSNGKEGYVFKKLDKPNAAPAPIAGRNSGGVQPELKLDTSEAQIDLTTTQGDREGAVDPDHGDAPNAAEIQALRDAAKKLGWAKPKAGAWLKANFGETSTDALTKDQCASALALLMAAQVDDNDAAYSAVYDKLKAAGKVL